MWRFLHNSESIEELRPYLAALKERHDQAGVKILVIYVDNCCTVRQKLQKIFPDATIVLDEYHWMKRWNDIVLDMKSEEAAIFKGCMRRAINVVSNNEYLDKKTELTESLKASQQ
jgi:transposase